MKIRPGILTFPKEQTTAVITPTSLQHMARKPYNLRYDIKRHVTPSLVNVRAVNSSACAAIAIQSILHKIILITNIARKNNNKRSHLAGSANGVPTRPQ